MASRRRKPMLEPETVTTEIMEENTQPLEEREETVESTVEVQKKEEVLEEKTKAEERPKVVTPSPKRHPRNIPKFTSIRKGV